MAVVIAVIICRVVSFFMSNSRRELENQNGHDASLRMLRMNICTVGIECYLFFHVSICGLGP